MLARKAARPAPWQNGTLPTSPRSCRTSASVRTNGTSARVLRFVPSLTSSREPHAFVRAPDYSAATVVVVPCTRVLSYITALVPRQS